jgi:hypothetical protein
MSAASPSHGLGLTPADRKGRLTRAATRCNRHGLGLTPEVV